MAEITLSVKTREKASTDLVRSRAAGMIPAVMYGHGLAPQMFWLNYIEFGKVFAKAGESSIINLVPEKGKAANVIVHEIQVDPLKSRFIHVDFFQVRMDEALETHVPLEFVGESPAVREQGGILVKTLEEVLISCLPKDLPHSIAVDLSVLTDLGKNIQVKELAFPAGVTVLTEAGTTVALVEAPRSEAEMASLDEKVEGDVTKVEGVIKEVPEAEVAAAPDAKSEKKPEKKVEKGK